MHGIGTKRGITIHSLKPVLLDISRSISRVGRGPATGIDRVELAYLRWALDRPAPVWSLARTSSGCALLDRSTSQNILQKLRGDALWGPKDMRAHIGLKTPDARGRAESYIRRHAAHMVPNSSSKLDLPQDLKGGVYINVGHSNVGPIFGSLKASGLGIVAMIHDVIPLTHPHFQASHSVERFRQKLNVITNAADLIIANSAETETILCQKANRVPECVVAHLGLPETDKTTATFTQDKPYFVTVGTIEPRKNHRFLMKVWDALGADAELHIIGQRGWNNADVFADLDALGATDSVKELGPLRDDELWPRLKGAQALLFPSFAEGFGFPGLEAAALGVPVICGDLAIHREVLGRYPVYAETSDVYSWKDEVTAVLNDRNSGIRGLVPRLPTWDTHFEIVDDALSSLST
ncbi:MAG: glycosyltransferase family 1 protein [Pseudomonadota bacterium]